MRHLARFAVMSGVAVAAACGGSSTPTGTTPPPPSGSVTITIKDFAFSPAAVTVKAGTTVQWANAGPSAHTTTSDAGVWASSTLNAPSSAGGYAGGGGGSTGGTFSFTFTQPGTYPYHCSIHPPSLYPGFTGTITVTP
jgi:plastocyanin